VEIASVDYWFKKFVCEQRKRDDMIEWDLGDLSMFTLTSAREDWMGRHVNALPPLTFASHAPTWRNARGLRPP
jgi:hypothetical protein